MHAIFVLSRTDVAQTRDVKIILSKFLNMNGWTTKIGVSIWVNIACWMNCMKTMCVFEDVFVYEWVRVLQTGCCEYFLIDSSLTFTQYSTMVKLPQNVT